MAMTAKELIKSSIPRVKEASKYVKIKSVTPGFLKNKAHKITAQAYSIATNDGTPKQRREIYKCVVYGLTPETRLKKDAVKVSCTCEDFCFTCEYALHKKGAADMYFCNGEPPDVRNPKQVPTICKHLYKVLKDMLKEGV